MGCFLHALPCEPCNPQLRGMAHSQADLRVLGIGWVWIQGQLCTSDYLVSSSVNLFLTSTVSLLKVSGTPLPRLRARINQDGVECGC